MKIIQLDINDSYKQNLGLFGDINPFTFTITPNEENLKPAVLLVFYGLQLLFVP